MADLVGRTVALAERRMTTGIVRVVSSGRVRIVLGTGEAIECKDTDTYKVGDVVAVNVSTLASGQALVWNSFVQQWQPAYYLQVDSLGRLQFTLSANGNRITGLGAPSGTDDAVRLQDLDAAVLTPERAAPFVGTDSPLWASHATNGWTGAASGSGLFYLANPRYFSWLQSEPFSFATAETGGDTTGTPARVVYPANATAFLSDGALLFFECAISNLSELAYARIGFLGNHATTAATGRPTVFVGLEFDRSTDATNWRLVSTDGTTTGTSSTTATPPNGVIKAYLIHFTPSAITFYEVDRTGAADPTQIGSTITTGIPSTDQQRAGRRMWQVEKLTSGASSARGHLQVGRFCFLRPSSSFPSTAIA